MSGLDYSKWDHIELSDDEDDTHPNIDTPSLFRWRHQARLERMEEAKSNKSNLEKNLQTTQQKMIEIKHKLKDMDIQKEREDAKKLETELEELEKQEEEFRQKEEEILKKERLTPWNVDTISHESHSRTIINKIEPVKEVELTEEEKGKLQVEFTEKYEEEIKHYGMLQKYDASQRYLEEHKYLVCEETANYLVIWCINLEMEKSSSLMGHVAHQTIVLQFMLELARSLKIDPRSCVGSFFSRLSKGEPQYMSSFNEELNAFKKRIRNRAREKLDLAMKEVEQEEKQKRLGPGGLDPLEVFETLPKPLQQCFENRDIKLLQETVAKMDPKDGEYHIKRCIDSGLWLPGGDSTEDEKDTEDKKVEETVYEACKDE